MEGAKQKQISEKRHLTPQEAYGLLAGFIQDYIYQKGWDRLNPLQTRAIEYILPAKNNVLLMAGTAQGKTEAAFLPAISCLYKVGSAENADPPSREDSPAVSGPDRKAGVGILYISPLKALINDQFFRIEDMLKGTDLRITKWHGDALASGKNRLLDKPGGIVQMTPESLEAMFACHPERIPALFSGLHFIIIDEIHYFMNSERGLQLLALFERLSRRTGCRPVRIGLSATISDPRQALSWLNTGSGRKGKVISWQEQGRRVLCSLTATPIGKEEFPERYIKKIYLQTKGKRALLFAPSRRMAEILVAKVRQMALSKNMPDVYHVHHGSIAKEFREETERIMKQEEGPVLTGTTLTLELGIDIGSLDEVIQTSDPPSISSMVQRLGRSGRRTGQAAVSFQLRYLPDKGDRRKLDLSLVRSIAMIELYFRDHYLEGQDLPRRPYHLMVHEILALLAEKGCLQPKILAGRLLDLSIFRYVSEDDLRDLLLHLVEKKVVCIYEDGAVGLDDRGEGIIASMDFYAVFVAEVPMTVVYDGMEIGTVDRAYRPGDVFFLAGRSWEVTDRDMGRKRLTVIEAGEEADVQFAGFGETVTDRRLMEKIHEILASDSKYAYLDQEAEAVLSELRAKAARYRMNQEFCLDDDGSLLFHPALSGKTLLTIFHILRAHDINCDRLLCRDFLYGFRVRGTSESELRNLYRKLATKKYLIDYGYVNHFIRPRGKYFSLLPENLKGKEIISDLLDLDGAREYFQSQTKNS